MADERSRTRVFDKFTTLPRVLALNDFFLDEGYNISVFHTIQINPGEKPQELHYDDGSCQLPRPRRPMGTAIMLGECIAPQSQDFRRRCSLG